MDPVQIAAEIEKVEHELKALRIFSLYGGRCTRCQRRTSIALAIPKDLQAEGKLHDGKLFEIVDGFCKNPDCPDPDSLWRWLCRHDPAREPFLGSRPEFRMDGMCDNCLGTKVSGIWRDGTCTIGECLLCNTYSLLPSYDILGVRAFNSFMRKRDLLQKRLIGLSACRTIANLSTRQAV